MSNKAKLILYTVGFAALLVWLWLQRRKADTKTDKAIVSVVLPPQDEEKLVINQHTHTITEIKRNEKGQEEIKKSFLPPTASVELTKSGKLNVSARRWGTEMVPAIGIAYGSDFTLRAAGTLQLFYVQRWEVGAGMLLASHIAGCRADANVTYNIYDNVLVGGYVDNHRDAGIIAALKF